MGVVVCTSIDVKQWMERVPSADEARPRCCVGCRAASQPVGEGLRIWGHGLRERQVVGPLAPGGPAERVVLLVRRYLCCVCGCLMTVVPGLVTPRRWYPVWVIVLALASWAAGRSSWDVRCALSPDRSHGPGWPSLRRWSRTAGLWPAGSPNPEEHAPRGRARALVQAYAGYAPPPHGRLSLLEAAVAGARQAMGRDSGELPPGGPTQ